MSDKNNTPPAGTGAIGSAPTAPGVAAAPGAPGAPGAPAGPVGPGGTTLPRRSPGHRGQDQRDTVAEMIQKAHEISLEAGSKMATVMKDVIYAAAGITPFAAESARDLVNYMVRRGQMGAEEAERIRREIEGAAEKRGTPVRPAGKPAPKEEPKSFSPFTRPTTPPPVAVPAPPVVSAPPVAVAKKPAAPAKKPAAPAAKKPAVAKAPAKKPAPKKK